MSDKFSSVFELASKNKRTSTIEEARIINDLAKDGRRDAKNKECLFCKREVSSFCNSHSIPAFSLKNISKEGKLLTINNFLEIPIVDIEKGVQSIGTFRNICRECDSKIFLDYENSDNYTQLPTQKMLSQVALKNFLHRIYKKVFEISFLNKSRTLIKNPYNEIGQLQAELIEIELYKRELDLKEYNDKYKQAKRNLEKNWNEYIIIYYKILPYIVPIAFQDNIALHVDLDDNMINNVYDFNLKNKIKEIHLAVLPLEKTTGIVMFVHTEDKSRYNNFIKSFKKKAEDEQLKIINFIILSYSENFFLSPYLPEEIKNNEKIREVALLSSDGVIETSNIAKAKPNELLAMKYSFNNIENIPNLLSKEYQICKKE